MVPLKLTSLVSLAQLGQVSDLFLRAECSEETLELLTEEFSCSCGVCSPQLVLRAEALRTPWHQLVQLLLAMAHRGYNPSPDDVIFLAATGCQEKDGSWTKVGAEALANAKSTYYSED